MLLADLFLHYNANSSSKADNGFFYFRGHQVAHLRLSDRILVPGKEVKNLGIVYLWVSSLHHMR
jgi:hypothetical protein